MTYTIDLSPAEDSLTWQYEVRNDGTTRIAVLNGPERAAPDDDPPVWVVNAGDGTVEVSQRLHDLPDGLAYDEPLYAGGSILEPGESLTGSATVALPLALHHPHVRESDLDSYPGYALPERPQNVMFCLGILELAPDWDDSWWFAHDGMARDQHLLCTDTEPLP